MKISEAWLREWVNPSITRDALCDTLTMAGLEVDGQEPVAPAFSHVVVGRIIEIAKHSSADKLNICQVDAGQAKPLTIVCGASNARVNLVTAVALIGATLPDNLEIKATTIRDQASHGMLCSAKELGLSDEHSGILELPNDSPIGKDLRQLLLLDDYVLDVSITPNRSDCLSVQGLAREVSALTNTKVHPVVIKPAPSVIQDHLPITLTFSEGCPRYVGRIIKNVRVDEPTPIWLKERLRRSGIRSINIIVDITNYVMLELGQPMHAFDIGALQEGIEVRLAHKDEPLTLLDGKEIKLNEHTMIIADSVKPLAMAGVMGGLRSGVTLLTKHIFLESAYFSPTVIARQRQHYQLQSESAYRFERGVDPSIQQQAIERATQLILEIAGGEAGTLTHVQAEKHMPAKRTVSLPHAKIARVLGMNIPEETAAHIFTALSFTHKKVGDTWQVEVPAYRFDISIPEDLIEELARVHGYSHIPTRISQAELSVEPLLKEQNNWINLRLAFAHQGFHECLTYSFVDAKKQAQLDPDHAPYPVLNPISADMAVMRTNLFPGLINTLQYNQSRQQDRIRLFEIGRCFLLNNKTLEQPNCLGGLISGSAANEQWGEKTRDVDFFDLKGELDNILNILSKKDEYTLTQEAHPALHPGQSAAFYLNDKKIGFMGLLHPTLMKAFDLNKKVYLFHFNLDLVNFEPTLVVESVSKFPEIRRDLALLVNEAVPAESISYTIKTSAGDWLKDVFIFDVYQGKGIEPGKKSIALGMILQHPTRTLIDEEVADLMGNVTSALKDQLGATLRS